MKIAISNLAWEHSEDDKVLTLLKKFDIKGVEVAPSKVWQNLPDTSEEELREYKNYWNKKGIEIVATTSLLFGHPELQLFESEETREKMLKYLSKMMRITKSLGAKAMVFGSPKNRITNGLPKEDVEKIACEFFAKIAEEAEKNDVYFGIEANPPIYGTDFINTTPEAIQLAKLVNHLHFGVHLDVNTMTVNKENYLKTIQEALPYSHHFHISEPSLKPIPTDDTNHQEVAAAIKKSGYRNWVSIEMPLPPEVNHLQQIEKTLEFVTSVYK